MLNTRVSGELLNTCNLDESDQSVLKLQSLYYEYYGLISEIDQIYELFCVYPLILVRLLRMQYCLLQHARIHFKNQHELGNVGKILAQETKEYVWYK